MMRHETRVASSSDSDDDDSTRVPTAPPLPPGVVPPPPAGAYESRLWKHMNEVLPEKAGVLSVRGVDFGSERYQLLHQEIDDIVRTKGRMNHSELVCLEDPTSRDASPMNNSNSNNTATAPSIGSPISPRLPGTQSKQHRNTLNPRKTRFLAMKTVSYETYLPAVYAKAGRNATDSMSFSSFRFSFITLFFVGVACGKFKRLLRRRTLAEQQERYGEMLGKSVAARLALISKPEAKNYSTQSARDLVVRTTKEGSARFNAAIRTSNENARRVKLNPKATLARHNSTVDPLLQSLPTVTPGVTMNRAELGEFLLNRPFITAGPPHAYSSRHGSLDDHGALMSASLAASPFNATHASPRSIIRFGDCASGGGLPQISPRHGSFVRDEAPSIMSSTTRVIPAFEQYADANVFVMNLAWDEMEYIPLCERSKKTLLLQRQAKESDLQKFTQSVAPASSKRIQASYEPKKPLPGDPLPGDGTPRDGGSPSGSDARHHQLGSVSSFSTFGGGAKPPSSHHLLALQQANLDVDLKGVAVYEPGKRSTARSVNVSGIRATRSIAKPSPTPFDFFSWRVKQNRALFHHLCQEHRELLDTATTAGAHHNHSNGTTTPPILDEDGAPSPAQAGGGGVLSTAELQALRERVRRRAEDVEFNDRDSASTTYHTFLVHKDVEHVDFLKRSMAEVERLLATKDALSRKTKRAQLLETIDKPDGANVLVERFVETVGQLEKGIRRQLKQSIVEENVVYNRGWILTLRGRLQLAFDGALPAEVERVMSLAVQTTDRCSHRDLMLRDLEEGVVNELSDDEAMSPAAQFALERLLPAFSSTESHAHRSGGGPQTLPSLLTEASSIDPKQFLRNLYIKKKIPFVLLCPEDEKEHKELFGLSLNDKMRYMGGKQLRSIEQLNTVMEPHFDKLALAALNSVEARHAGMRIEHRKLLEQMAKAEEDALIKAASLERRSTRRQSVSDASSREGHALPGRRKSSVVHAIPLGMDSISPTLEKARRSSRRESGGLEIAPIIASPRRASVMPPALHNSSEAVRLPSIHSGRGNNTHGGKAFAPEPPDGTVLERRSSRVTLVVPHPPVGDAATNGAPSSIHKVNGGNQPFHTPSAVSTPPLVVVAEPCVNQS